MLWLPLGLRSHARPSPRRAGQAGENLMAGNVRGLFLTEHGCARQPLSMRFAFNRFLVVCFALTACGLGAGCSSTTTTEKVVEPPAPVTTSSTTSTTNTTTTTQPDGTVVRATTTTIVSNGRVMEKDVRTTYTYPNQLTSKSPALSESGH